jgi:hypothetical protein
MSLEVEGAASQVIAAKNVARTRGTHQRGGFDMIEVNNTRSQLMVGGGGYNIAEYA